MSLMDAQQLKECDRKVAGLRSFGFAIWPDRRDVGGAAYVIAYSYRRAAVVTIRIVLFDWQEPEADLVITNMTTLPTSRRSQGAGGRALAELLRWASEHELDREIRATQVSDERAADFWIDHGFQRVPGHPCGDFVRRELPRVVPVRPASSTSATAPT